jgi:hypothetical protein
MPPKGLSVAFLDPKKQQAKAAQAAELRRAAQLVLPLLPEEHRAVARAAVEQTAGDLEDAEVRWGFVMVSRRHLPRLIAIADQTSRPRAAYKVVLASLAYLGKDDSTIQASRAELAKDCGLQPHHVGEVMTELAAFGVVSVRKVGRRMVYAFNPSVAWRGAEAARLAKARAFESVE